MEGLENRGHLEAELPCLRIVEEKPFSASCEVEMWSCAVIWRKGPLHLPISFKIRLLKECAAFGEVCTSPWCSVLFFKNNVLQQCHFPI